MLSEWRRDVPLMHLSVWINIPFNVFMIAPVPASEPTVRSPAVCGKGSSGGWWFEAVLSHHDAPNTWAAGRKDDCHSLRAWAGQCHRGGSDSSCLCCGGEAGRGGSRHQQQKALCAVWGVVPQHGVETCCSHCSPITLLPQSDVRMENLVAQMWSLGLLPASVLMYLHSTPGMLKLAVVENAVPVASKQGQNGNASLTSSIKSNLLQAQCLAWPWRDRIRWYLQVKPWFGFGHWWCITFHIPGMTQHCWVDGFCTQHVEANPTWVPIWEWGQIKLLSACFFQTVPSQTLFRQMNKMSEWLFTVISGCVQV